MRISRANDWLSRLVDAVEHDLNPSGEDCSCCGGDGYIYDCIDDMCFDAEYGCEDCARRCLECHRHEIDIRREVRTEVLRAMDIELGRAFLIRFLNPQFLTDTKILINLHAGRVGSDAFSTDERADSACWVEGLL